MRTLLKLSLSLLITAVLSLGMTSGAYAWGSSTTVTVKAAGNYSAITFWGSFQCKDAALLIEGRTYPVSVSKSPWSNTCTVSFANVPVNKSGQMYINAYDSFAKKWITTDWIWVSIGRPSWGSEVNVGTFQMRMVR